jgi:cytoskeletal protein RodZ
MATPKINSQIKNKSIGNLLREKREEKDFTIAQASTFTKIRGEFIEALENGNYSMFASDVYAKGFLKNYAKFLGLDSDQVLALYRREHQPVPLSQDLRLNQPKRKSQMDSILTRRNLLLISIGLILVLVGFYVTNQVNSLLQPPLFELVTPVKINADFDGEIYVPGNSFKVTGKTTNQTIVRMNAEPVELEPDYTFETSEIPLRDAENIVIFTATNQFGRTATIKLKVKKGSTGIATTTKMSILVEIKNEATPLLIRTDGVIKFNDRAFPGDVISLEATNRLQIESEAPYNIKLTINGNEQIVSDGDLQWELIDGKVISNQSL